MPTISLIKFINLDFKREFNHGFNISKDVYENHPWNQFNFVNIWMVITCSKLKINLIEID